MVPEEGIPVESMSVAGPSHVRRFRRAIATGLLASPRRKVHWNDLAAASILHPYFEQCEFSRQSVPALVFVPDFRLGNRSIEDPDDPDAYLKVEKRLMTREHDEIMYDRVMSRVEEIHRTNPRARFFMWSLAWREFSNRTQGRYFDKGVYRHPVWNLSSAEGRTSGAAISLQAIFDHPMGDRLHVDGSGHPSYVGLELFRKLVDEPHLGVGQHLDRLAEYLGRPVFVLPKDMVMSGDSVWLEALDLYVSKGLVKLHPQTRVVAADRLAEESVGTARRVLFVSQMRPQARLKSGVQSNMASLERMRTLEKMGYRVLAYFWESRADEVLHPVLKKSRSDPSSTAALVRHVSADLNNGIGLVEGAGAPSFVLPRDVEVSHPTGSWPTVSGLCSVIETSGGVCRRESFPEVDLRSWP